MSKKIEKMAKEWYKASQALRKQCEGYFTDLLRRNNGSVSWEDMELPEYVSVSYDGGNHPEYASNVFSTVFGMKLETDGSILLNTEDCDEYDIQGIPVSEIYALYDFLERYKEIIGVR